MDEVEVRIARIHPDAALPEKGKANEAVVELLAERLGLSTDALAVASGHSSPSKVIAIKGLDDEAIDTALGGPW